MYLISSRRSFSKILSTYDDNQKNYVVIIGLPIQILFLSVPNYAQGEPIYSSFDIRFEEGLRCYNSAKFNIAMGILQNYPPSIPLALNATIMQEKVPANLQQANWFKASELARKTLKFFKKRIC